MNLVSDCCSSHVIGIYLVTKAEQTASRPEILTFLEQLKTTLFGSVWLGELLSSPT